MRLLINTSLLRFGGPVQVALSIIHECRQHEQHEFHVVLGPGVSAVLQKAEFPRNFEFYEKSFGVMNLLKTGRVQNEMAALEARIQPDCVVTTAGPAYWRSRAPHLMGFNLGLYLYLDSPYVKSLRLRERARFQARRWLHTRYFRNEADALYVQTDDVNRRVRQLIKTKNVSTITNNCSAWFNECPPVPNRLPKREYGRFRFVTVSSYYPHKNLELIPEILKELSEKIRSQVEFVLTLSADEYRQRIGGVVPKQLRLVGPVPPPACPALYAECDAMFLPTLAECFSASYPEAMKMEKPIVTTDLSFARSICGDAALYFRACDASSAAGQIERLIQDRVLQRELIEKGRKRLSAFDTPLERAEKILFICQDLATGHDRVPAANFK